MNKQEDIRINVGCGGRPLAGYVNLDMDTVDELRQRYPDNSFPDDLKIFQYDIFNLPYPDGTVAEIRADSLVEHLSFTEEPLFFEEVKRALRPGGLFIFSTPDFEDTVKKWLAAKDEWKDFFRSDLEAVAKQHWFGQYSYSTASRWGYLTASIFGSQSSTGQGHKNCYTIPKIKAILARMGFEEEEISTYRWKGDRELMILAKARKK